MAKKCARILAILIRFSQFIDLQIVVFSNQATYRCILLKRSETAAFLVSKKSQSVHLQVVARCPTFNLVTLTEVAVATEPKACPERRSRMRS